MSISKRAYYETRNLFFPIVGMIYTNENGERYKCIEENFSCPTMQNIKSGWTCKAHGVGIYSDGKIDWNYSTNGHFEEVQK